MVSESISRPRRDELQRLRSYNQFASYYENIPAMTADLPRIAAMGFTSIWVNPLFAPSRDLEAIKKEITRGIDAAGGENSHKRLHAKAGSPYALRGLDINSALSAHKDEKLSAAERRGRDYADIRAYTDKARELGMTPLFDFVMRHVAVDNPLVAEHPHWFKRHANGNFMFFGRDENYRTHSQSWDDVLEFDYGNPQATREIIDQHLKPMAELVVKQFGFAGLRIDAAGMVPDQVYREIVPFIDKLCLEEHGAPALMLGETLGQDVSHFLGVGGHMDYVYNSVYFYPFTKNFWLADNTSLSYAKGMLQQHVGPTVGFIGNHDVTRGADHYLNNKHVRGTALQTAIRKGCKNPHIREGVLNLFSALCHKGSLEQDSIDKVTRVIDLAFPGEDPAKALLSYRNLSALMVKASPTSSRGRAIYGAITDVLFAAAYREAAVDEYGATYHSANKGPLNELDLVKLLPLNTDRENLTRHLRQAMCFAAFASDGGWFFQLGDEWGVTKRTNLFTASPRDLQQRAAPDLDLSGFVGSVNKVLAQLPGPVNLEWVQRCYLQSPKDPGMATFLIHQGEGFSQPAHMIVANLGLAPLALSLADYKELRRADGRNTGPGKDAPPACVYLCGNIELSVALQHELARTGVKVFDAEAEKTLTGPAKVRMPASPDRHKVAAAFRIPAEAANQL
ncbi:MAG: alpha-amylase family glycosyl hydrolase [Alphaproteobacteria bacterium]|nr:alpha-amylase family glycosyl hydrolase [Alphaproteobacteria bacterium]